MLKTKINKSNKFLPFSSEIEILKKRKSYVMFKKNKWIKLKDITLIPDSFLMFLISITSLQLANPNFIEGIVVIPPAKKAELEEASFDASLTSLGA